MNGQKDYAHPDQKHCNQGDRSCKQSHLVRDKYRKVTTHPVEKLYNWEQKNDRVSSHFLAHGSRKVEEVAKDQLDPARLSVADKRVISIYMNGIYVGDQVQGSL